MSYPLSLLLLMAFPRRQQWQLLLVFDFHIIEKELTFTPIDRQTDIELNPSVPTEA